MSLPITGTAEQCSAFVAQANHLNDIQGLTIGGGLATTAIMASFEPATPPFEVARSKHVPNRPPRVALADFDIIAPFGLTVEQIMTIFDLGEHGIDMGLHIALAGFGGVTLPTHTTALRTGIGCLPREAFGSFERSFADAEGRVLRVRTLSIGVHALLHTLGRPARQMERRFKSFAAFAERVRVRTPNEFPSAAVVAAFDELRPRTKAAQML